MSRLLSWSSILGIGQAIALAGMQIGSTSTMAAGAILSAIGGTLTKEQSIMKRLPIAAALLKMSSK